MSKRANSSTAATPGREQKRPALGSESDFDIDSIFADAEADVDEEVRGKGGRRTTLTMGESITEHGGAEERARYELFMDTQLPEIAKARTNLSQAASNPLSLEWSKREETVTEVPVEREPSWRLYDPKARNAQLFFKTDWCRNLLSDVPTYKDFERHMRMTALEWQGAKGARSTFPIALGASSGLLVEWLEKHRRIDLWRVTYLRIATGEGSGADMGRLEDASWLGRALREATKISITPSFTGVVAFDFNMNDAGDYILRLCYAFGALDKEQERRSGAPPPPGLAREADFLQAFAAERNTIGIFSEGRTRLVLDRREFYHLWRGVTREYVDGEEESPSSATTSATARVVHGPTKLPLSFVGYYYFLINPKQQSTLRPPVVSSLNPLDIMRRERMTINQSLLSIDDPYK